MTGMQAEWLPDSIFGFLHIVRHFEEDQSATQAVRSSLVMMGMMAVLTIEGASCHEYHGHQQCQDWLTHLHWEPTHHTGIFICLGGESCAGQTLRDSLAKISHSCSISLWGWNFSPKVSRVNICFHTKLSRWWSSSVESTIVAVYPDIKQLWAIKQEPR